MSKSTELYQNEPEIWDGARRCQWSVVFVAFMESVQLSVRESPQRVAISPPVALAYWNREKSCCRGISVTRSRSRSRYRSNQGLQARHLWTRLWSFPRQCPKSSQSDRSHRRLERRPCHQVPRRLLPSMRVYATVCCNRWRAVRAFASRPSAQPVRTVG